MGVQLMILLCLLSYFVIDLMEPVSCHLWQNMTCSTDHRKAGLFVFGDSLYDPGNNNYINTTTQFQANFWPYGESFFFNPSSAPTGRFSNGRLIPDFLAEYAELPILQTYLQPGKHQFIYGSNFASGGAGALDETYSGLVVNLRTQVRYFKKVEKQLKRELGGEKEARQLLSDSVYLISIGGNDYLSPARGDSKQSLTQDEFIDIVIGNFTAAVKQVYKRGGRKFGFISLPPIGCLPSIRTLNAGAANTTSGGQQHCDEDLNDMVEQHNKALLKSLKKLEKQLQGFMYSHFDLYTILRDQIDNPSKYGFKEGKTACCGSGPYRGVYSCGGTRGVKEYELCENASEYLFFDSNHPTEVAYQQLARLMWESGDSGVNLKSLFQITGPVLDS